MFNNQDFSLCEAIFARDYVEHAVAPFQDSEPGAVNGPAHARSVVEWLRSQFPDLQMTVEEAVGTGDMVVARVFSEGTNLGPLNGAIPPTGRRFAAYQDHWYRIEGGRLAEHWAVRDDLTAMLQLGVITPPRPPRPG